jgi:hypothetical protein
LVKYQLSKDLISIFDVDQWFSNQKDRKDKAYAFLSFVEQSIKDLVQSSYNHSIEENYSDFAKGITGNGKPNVLLMSRYSKPQDLSFQPGPRTGRFAPF